MNTKPNYTILNHSGIIACHLKQPLPFCASSQTIILTPDTKAEIVWGFVLSDLIKQNTLTDNLILIKNLHDKNYKTFVVIPISSSNLVSAFGYFNAARPHCDLIQFHLEQPITKSILSLFIDTVIDNLDTTIQIYFPDNLLFQAGLSRSQLPAQCQPVYFFK